MFPPHKWQVKTQDWKKNKKPSDIARPMREEPALEGQTNTMHTFRDNPMTLEKFFDNGLWKSKAPDENL